MSSEDGGVKAVVALVFAGSGLFYKGLKTFKRRRQILDIPTSKIDSAAIGGLVEIVGKIVCDKNKIITSPLSSKDCAGFYWEILEYVRRGKNSYWKRVSEFYSNHYVLVNDGGKFNAAIDLQDAIIEENTCVDELKFKDSKSDLPLKVYELLKNSKSLDVKDDNPGFFSLSFKNQYKIIEHRFPINTNIYVLGESYPKEKIVFKKSYIDKVNHKKLFEQSCQEHKLNPSLLKSFDKDGNNKLDRSEIRDMKSSIKQSLLSEFNNGTSDEEIKKAHIFFKASKSKNRIFNSNQVLVSFKSQENTLTKLTFIAYGSFILGPIMIGAGFILGTYIF
jgi:acyl-CoA-binding protein